MAEAITSLLARRQAAAARLLLLGMARRRWRRHRGRGPSGRGARAAPGLRPGPRRRHGRLATPAAGRPAVHRRFAALHRGSSWLGSPEAFGTGAAILLGDLCLSLGRRAALRVRPVADDALLRAKPVYDEMRTELMAGQYLDLLEQARGGGSVERALLRGPLQEPRSTRSSGRCTSARTLAGADAEPARRRTRPTGCRSARPSSCATTSSASSATRPRRASRPATTCARASGRCSSPWPSNGRRPAQAAAAASPPRRPRGSTPTVSTRCARSSARPGRSREVEGLIATAHRDRRWPRWPASAATRARSAPRERWRSRPPTRRG